MRPVIYPRPTIVTGLDGTQQSIVYNYLAPVTGTATSIATAQAGTGGTKLNLNGSTAGILDVARLITAVSSNAGDTAIVLAIVGTNWFGATITENLTLNGTTTVTSVNDYLTITSITPQSTPAGNISVGTVVATGPVIANSPPIPVSLGSPFNVTLNMKVTGTVNWSVQQTLDNPWVYNPDAQCQWIAVVAGGTSQTGAVAIVSTNTVQAYRLVINTNTAPGGALIEVAQAQGLTAL